MKFRRIAVLKGGWSPEREVSLNSGAQAAKALKTAGYEVVEIDAGRDLADQLTAARPDAVEHVEPCLALQRVVERDDVDASLGDPRKRVGAVADMRHRMAATPERLADQSGQRLVVLDIKNDDGAR